MYIPVELTDLTDVDVTSTTPTDGQALVWDDTSSLWIPGVVSGGGGGVVPNAKATRMASQSIPNNATTEIVWDTEDWDTDTIVDVAGANPERLVARTAGKYHVSAGVSWGSNTTGIRQILIRVNGSSHAYNAGDAPNGIQWRRTLSVDVNLSVNDYVTVGLYQNSGGALSTEANRLTFITMHKVSD